MFLSDLRVIFVRAIDSLINWLDIAFEPHKIDCHWPNIDYPSNGKLLSNLY